MTEWLKTWGAEYPNSTYHLWPYGNLNRTTSFIRMRIVWVSRDECLSSLTPKARPQSTAINIDAYAPLLWMTTAPIPLGTIQGKEAYTLASTLTIHSLQYSGCSVHFQQHVLQWFTQVPLVIFTNQWLIPSRKTKDTSMWERYLIQGPLQVTHQLNLEIYSCS